MFLFLSRISFLYQLYFYHLLYFCHLLYFFIFHTFQYVLLKYILPGLSMNHAERFHSIIHTFLWRIKITT